MPRRLVAMVGSVVLITASASFAQAPPAVKGRWTLNRELSGDIEARMKEAAGSQYMKGGPGWAPPETWLPIGVKFDEAERLEVRAFLLALIPSLSRLEIEVSPVEIKTVHGDTARIFNLTRKNAGSNAITGQTVARHATLQGTTLVLDSKGKDSHLIETITVGADGKRMTCVVHFEEKLLEKPLDLNLVYDRAAR